MKYKILLKFKEVYDKPGFQFRKNQKQKLPLKRIFQIMGKSILKNNVKRNISFILRIKPNKGGETMIHFKKKA